MTEWLKFGSFLATGTATTSIDFIVFNALTSQRIRLPLIPANCVSTAVAMTFSFLVNGCFVFSSASQLTIHHAVRYLLVTSFSSFVLQNGVIYGLDFARQRTARFARIVVEVWSARPPFTVHWLQKNVIKAIAVIVGLIWNFFWFRHFVYR
jgi:putative flippase GtrA